MFRRATVAVLSAGALVLSSLVRADALEFSVSIGDGPLFTGLKALESQTGIELLYDGDVVRELRSPRVVGKLTTEVALQQLLSETELTIRRAASGAWIIERRTTPPLAQQDAAVAEILVVGRRTQNADIRRFEDDVQPYTVATREEIIHAHRDNIDGFISSRVTSNTTILPSIASQSASVMSSINLRGMGELDTVVLVDGRRMPSIPESDLGFFQSDVNAIPLHAIERIEVLTGAAGGIHGFGALGGVVNIVLDRDIDGLEFHTTQGISSRGDARRHGLEVKFGRKFNDGATTFMLSGGHQEVDTVRVRDRSFAVRDRRRVYDLAPDYYAGLYAEGNSLRITSVYRVDPDTSEFVLNPDLTLKPELGGGDLGSNLTYLPLGFSGNAAALPDALREHAGEMDFSIADNEARNDLGPNPQSDALFANLRHRFEFGWEAYADAVMLRSRGETFGSPQLTMLSYGLAIMAPESPANPFNELVTVSYPIAGLDSGVRKRIDTTRYTAGIEGELPLQWRGIAEASWGRVRYFRSIAESLPLSGTFYYLTGDASDLDTNPLGDWNTFDRGLRTDVLRSREDSDFHTRYGAQSIRLAGPVFETRAGPATLTLLAERRSERVPPSKEVYFLELGDTSSEDEHLEDPRSRLTHSYYGELRSKLFRNLELQLAVRHDEQKDDFQRTQIYPDSGVLHSRFAGTAFTVGAKTSPTDWLMLRGSYSTGKQPPPIVSLVEADPFTYGPDDEGLQVDPKRGGTELAEEGELLVYGGGNSKLKATHAKTVSLGAVLAPGGVDGPRFALDYSRIRRTRDLQEHNVPHILAHEDYWPERVVRAPLTDADRANGYTGGRIEIIDARVANDSATEVEAFDLRMEWPLSFLNGRLRLYADATYQKRKLQMDRFEPVVTWAGYLEGPLKRRANGGVDWSKNQLTIGANLQYFGSSLILDEPFPNLPLFPDDDEVMFQGSARIPSQSYLDLYGSWRLPVQSLGSVDSLSLDFGVVNVLDKAPPRESSYVSGRGPSYSRYGDARMRRFELGLSCHF
jgi:iron complex outermembrane recepter protein